MNPFSVTRLLGFLILAVWCMAGISGHALATETPTSRTVILLDASASMQEVLNDGTPKMRGALVALHETLNQLPAGGLASIRVYGGLVGGQPLQATPCSGSSRLAYGAIPQYLEALQPYGSTPISKSIVQAINEDLAPYPSIDWNIVLISDGAETCSINPCRVLVDLVKAHPNLKIHTVGFGRIDSATVNQLQCLSSGTWANFIKANSLDELKAGLGDVFNGIGSTRAILLNGKAQPSTRVDTPPSQRDIRF
jgi:Ca-activated chloride channel homolog